MDPCCANFGDALRRTSTNFLQTSAVKCYKTKFQRTGLRDERKQFSLSEHYPEFFCQVRFSINLDFFFIHSFQVWALQLPLCRNLRPGKKTDHCSNRSKFSWLLLRLDLEPLRSGLVQRQNTLATRISQCVFKKRYPTGSKYQRISEIFYAN